MVSWFGWSVGIKMVIATVFKRLLSGDRWLLRLPQHLKGKINPPQQENKSCFQKWQWQNPDLLFQGILNHLPPATTTCYRHCQHINHRASASGLPEAARKTKRPMRPKPLIPIPSRWWEATATGGYGFWWVEDAKVDGRGYPIPLLKSPRKLKTPPIGMIKIHLKKSTSFVAPTNL